MLSRTQAALRDRKLAQVSRLLSLSPLTASQVADKVRVTKATAYAWIKILIARKQARLAGKVRGLSGSWAKTYGPPAGRKDGIKNGVKP